MWYVPIPEREAPDGHIERHVVDGLETHASVADAAKPLHVDLLRVFGAHHCGDMEESGRQALAKGTGDEKPKEEKDERIATALVHFDEDVGVEGDEDACAHDDSVDVEVDWPGVVKLLWLR